MNGVLGKLSKSIIFGSSSGFKTGGFIEILSENKTPDNGFVTKFGVGSLAVSAFKTGCFSGSRVACFGGCSASGISFFIVVC